MNRQRKWRDEDELVGLGLPRSTLRDLDTVRGIRADLWGTQKTLNSVLRAREGIVSANAALDRYAGVIERAKAPLGLASARIPSAIKTLEERTADARTALGRANPTLFESGLGSISKPRIPTFATPRAAEGVTRMTGLLNLPRMATQGPSAIPSFGSSIMKASDVFKGLTEPKTPSLFALAAGIADGRRSVLAPPALAGLGKAGFGYFQEDSGRQSILNGLRDTSFLGDLPRSPVLHGAGIGVSQKTLAEIFGTLDTAATVAAARPSYADQTFGLLRKMDGIGLGAGRIPRFTLPDLGSVTRPWGSMFENLERLARIDWEALRRAAERAARVREARRPRTEFGFRALRAYDELYMGNPRVADEFLVKDLGVEPDADRREALWIVLRQAFERTVTYPARWIVLDDARAALYLRSAVYKQAKRIRRDREKADRVWATEKDPKTNKKIELPPPVIEPELILQFMAQATENPEHIVVGSFDRRVQVLELLFSEGSDKDKRIVRMLIAGFDLPAVADVVGWPEVQRFMRKARRWTTIKF